MAIILRKGDWGADTINAGTGNDLIHGDLQNGNLLTSSGTGAATLGEMENGQGWTAGGNNGISQTIDTASGKTYTISCDLAANLAGGATCGSVEVLGNGEVIGAVTTTAGVFEFHSFEVRGDGGTGGLMLREFASATSGLKINMDGPIFSYAKDVEVGGDTVEVAAFAPGQSKLFQMVDSS